MSNNSLTSLDNLLRVVQEDPFYDRSSPDNTTYNGNLANSTTLTKAYTDVVNLANQVQQTGGADGAKAAERLRKLAQQIDKELSDPTKLQTIGKNYSDTQGLFNRTTDSYLASLSNAATGSVNLTTARLFTESLQGLQPKMTDPSRPWEQVTP